MKKLMVILSVALSLLMLMTCVGCSTGQPTSNEPTTASSEANEQSYPSQPITILVPWSAGGRGDIFGRTVATYLEKYLNQSVVVTNEPGGGGVTGTYTVANASPNGYMLGSFATTHLFAYFLKTPNFPLDKFRPVGGYAEIYECIVAKGDSPWNNLLDFIEDAKLNPGKYIHGNTGVGMDDHIYASALYNGLGVDVMQMPYDGDAGLVQGIISDEVDVAMIAMPSIASYVDNGDLKVLAISSKERLDNMPDAPTFVEQGIDFTETAFTGLYAPIDTPDEVINILDEALNKVRNDPEFQETLRNIYVSVNWADATEFPKLIEDTKVKIQDWLKILQDNGIDLGL